MKQIKKILLTILFLVIIVEKTYTEGYNGEIIAPNIRISVDYQGANLTDVLRSISFDNDLNMLINDEVQGSVTVNINNVLVDDLLEAILRTNGYTYLKSGDLVEVVSLDTVESLLSIEKPTSKTFKLKNIGVIEVVADIEKLIGENASIIEDENTNSITIRGKRRDILTVERYLNVRDSLKISQVQKNVELIRMKHLTPEEVYNVLLEMNYRLPGDIRVSDTLNSLIVIAGEKEVTALKSLIDKLDTPDHQVVIEARIVEVQEGDGRDWGISWQYNANKNEDNRGGSGSDGTVIDGSDSFLDVTDLTNGISLGLGLLGSDQFTAIYRNLVTNDTTEILARPTVTTLNRKTAKIDIIDEVPYKQLEYISENGGSNSSSFEFKEVGITLEVTPQISEDGYINMAIAPSISEVTGVTADGVPYVSTRSVETNVIIRGGETLAIGGLIKNNLTINETKDPLLSKIPLLGGLFKTNTKSDSKTNLMIFITPRLILNRDTTERVNLIKGEASVGIKSLEERAKVVETSTAGEEIPQVADDVVTGINRIQEKLKNAINASE